MLLHAKIPQKLKPKRLKEVQEPSEDFFNSVSFNRVNGLIWSLNCELALFMTAQASILVLLEKG